MAHLRKKARPNICLYQEEQCRTNPTQAPAHRKQQVVGKVKETVDIGAGFFRCDLASGKR